MAVNRALDALTAVFDDGGQGDDQQGGDQPGGDNQGGDNQGSDNQGSDNQGSDVEGRNASATRAVDRLENAIRRTTQVLLAELPYVTLLLRVRGNTDIERDALARRRAFDDRLATLVKQAADAGEIRDDIEPRLVTRLLFGMVNSITQWYRPGSRTTDPEIVTAVVSLALEGLGARRRRR